MRLDGEPTVVQERLAAAGPVSHNGDEYVVLLDAGEDPDAVVPGLVADLVALGVRVRAVEPGRISLEERLLGILREEAR
jgi:ABC-2 type transport system ATP-binding protein